MGNQQSIEAHRRPGQRLSKPKTNSRGTSALLSPNIFTNSPGRFSNPGLDSDLPPFSPATSTQTTASEIVAPSEENLQRRSSIFGRPKASRRRSLFRSKSTASERPNTSAGPDRGTTDQFSRANSMTYESAIAYYGPQPQPPLPENWQPPAGSRTSWNYNLTSYEAKRLLNLVEEGQLEQDTGMSETKMTAVSEATWKSSNPTQPIVATITRANSDLSLYTPVRRKSIIQTPGVATRSSSTRPSSRARNHRHSVPPTPNLSRQPSFENHRSGIMSMPMPPLTLNITQHSSVPRVVTPCEDAYQSIGAFKLGTLRITNGAASPVSPDMERSTNRTNGNHNAASDGSGYFSRGPTASELGVTGAAVQPPEVPKIVAPKPRPAQLSPIVTTFLHLDSPDGPTPVPPPKDSPRHRVEERKFLAEISVSPFALDKSSLKSPELQTTSKHTALEDELFEDETNEAQPEYISDEILDVRLDPNAKSQPGRSPTGTSPTKNVARTDSGFVSATSPSSDYSHHPLTKADSGYSSNVSLRSFHAKAQALDGVASASIHKQGSQSSQGSGSSSHGEKVQEGGDAEMPEAPLRDAPPPPVPPKDFPPVSPTLSKTSSIPRKAVSTSSHGTEARLSTSTQGSKKSRHSPSPIATLRSTRAGPKSPAESIPRTPASARSAKSTGSARSDSSNSALSIGSGSPRGNKLQRLLSGSRRRSTGPPTVYTTHVSEQNQVRAIPRDMQSKLNEHNGLYPMTTKRLALRAHPSLDTLKTIFSVGSMEAAHEFGPVVSGIPPVPEVEVFETDVTKSSPRRTLSLTNSISHAANFLIPRKPVVRKPVPVRQDSVKEKEKEDQNPAKSETAPSDESDLASYLSITDSMGGNAYDAAFKAMSDDRGVYFSPTSTCRTMSLTSSRERSQSFRQSSPLNRPSTAISVTANRPSTAVDRIKLPSPSLPSPILASMLELERQARTGSPVGMPMRRPGSLRVPPPLRSQTSTGRLSSTSVLHRTSRESIHSYPAGQPALQRSRTVSREDIRSYPPSLQQPTIMNYETSMAPPPIPPMNPRRNSAAKTPNWEVQTDHDISRRPSHSSVDSGSRHNSFSSASQVSANPWPRSANHPPLRHRASYDSHGPQRMSVYGQGAPTGHPPTMSNGYTAPVPSVKQQHAHDPWANHSYGPPSQQWDQYSRYPPQVHRSQGHYRNRSMGSRDNASNPPYRVLHSYNSPAYRNAPIWG